MARGNKGGDSGRKSKPGILPDRDLEKHGVVGDYTKPGTGGGGSQENKDKAAEKAGEDFDKQYDESKGDND